MDTKYTREQLMKLSNEELLEITNGQAVDFHLTDGRRTQLCVGDLLCLENNNYSFQTRTGITIKLQDVNYIEVIR